MTWEEFKAKVESEGVTDRTIIQGIYLGPEDMENFHVETKSWPEEEHRVVIIHWD